MIVITTTITITVTINITVAIMAVVVVVVVSVLVTVMMAMVRVVLVIVMMIIQYILSLEICHWSLCNIATITASLKFHFKTIKIFGSLHTVMDIVPHNWGYICFQTSGRHRE